MEEQNTQQLNQSAEPVQPIITDPKSEKKENNLLYVGIVIVVAVLIIGGYLVYANFFMSKASITENKTTTTTLAVEESSLSTDEIKTIADSDFKTTADLNKAINELDKVDLGVIDEELVKNDKDASGFLE